jgi:hypothetical protein
MTKVNLTDCEIKMTDTNATPDMTNAMLWIELDDAALGKLVKAKIFALSTVAERLEMTETLAAALLFCCSAAEQQADTALITLEGLTQGDSKFGDWRIEATRIN